MLILVDYVHPKWCFEVFIPLLFSCWGNDMMFYCNKGLQFIICQPLATVQCASLIPLPIGSTSVVPSYQGLPLSSECSYIELEDHLEMGVCREYLWLYNAIPLISMATSSPRPWLVLFVDHVCNLSIPFVDILQVSRLLMSF